MESGVAGHYIVFYYDGLVGSFLMELLCIDSRISFLGLLEKATVDNFLRIFGFYDACLL